MYPFFISSRRKMNINSIYSCLVAYILPPITLMQSRPISFLQTAHKWDYFCEHIICTEDSLKLLQDPSTTQRLSMEGQETGLVGHYDWGSRWLSYADIWGESSCYDLFIGAETIHEWYRCLCICLGSHPPFTAKWQQSQEVRYDRLQEQSGRTKLLGKRKGVPCCGIGYPVTALMLQKEIIYSPNGQQSPQVVAYGQWSKCKANEMETMFKGVWL